MFAERRDTAADDDDSESTLTGNDRATPRAAITKAEDDASGIERKSEKKYSFNQKKGLIETFQSFFGNQPAPPPQLVAVHAISSSKRTTTK